MHNSLGDYLMTNGKTKIKVAIITTPSGISSVHYLVKNLNVTGIIIDWGERGKKRKSPKTAIYDRIITLKNSEGYKGLSMAIINKIFKKNIFNDKMQRAIKAEKKFFRTLDNLFFGYPQLINKLDLHYFITFEQLSNYYDIPVQYVNNINDEIAASKLKEWEVDLGIIYGGRIIKPHILKIPKLGIINKHSSILPKHRGLASEYWCLYYEDFESLGVSIHFVEPGLDNGAIIVQKKMKFEKKDTPSTLRIKSDLIGREAMVEAVSMIEETGTRGTSQNEELATKNSRPTSETDRELYKKLPMLWDKYGE